MGFSDSRAESLKRGIEIVKNAPSLVDTQPEVHQFWNTVYLFQRKYEEAISEGKRSIELGSSDATSHILLSMTLQSAGRFEESIFHTKKAMRLDPYYPTWYLNILGLAYCMAEEYEKAIPLAKKGLERAETEGSQIGPHYNVLMHALVGLGKLNEARAQADAFLKIYPEWSLQDLQKVLFFKNPKDLERHLAALRKAGIPDKPPMKLPDKPSIAVLPFVNMSGDSAQEYIGDGLSENIISALSKVSKMFVISRNSTFTYKGKPVKVQQVAQELGVQYVLEGSVQKSGDRLRVTAQLIDAQTGHHRWSEKYDRKMRDLFDLQDEITKKIVVELQVELTYGEMARVYARDTENMEAWSNLVKGIKHSWRGNKEDILKGRKFIEKAIELDAKYVAAWSWLGLSYSFEWLAGMDKSPDILKRAYEANQKALELDENHPFGHAALASIYVHRGQPEKAVIAGRRAIALDPNYASGYLVLGTALRFTGRFEEAVNMVEKAMRLNPNYPTTYLRQLAECYMDAGYYEKAIVAFNQLNDLCKRGEGPLWWAPFGLAWTYAEMGKHEEARAHMAEALEANPKLSLKGIRPPYTNPAHRQRVVEALNKAGLPD
jgi:adenylate cyclase